jgi:hypothetical protein
MIMARQMLTVHCAIQYFMRWAIGLWGPYTSALNSAPSRGLATVLPARTLHRTTASVHNCCQVLLVRADDHLTTTLLLHHCVVAITDKAAKSAMYHPQSHTRQVAAHVNAAHCMHTVCDAVSYVWMAVSYVGTDTFLP